ncbi:uncharacterized protein LOC123869686 isoform X2 [Maniola jurtina]|uniref:uncharacterized protein LOC123869686 isoform X2 n=1 Tax=Maniola jurtina TaxID=191418 RepID=UPI001E68A059|nr:uncharacterized protein LOC123869686 isoform X2 [Maniola jurtina]
MLNEITVDSNNSIKVLRTLPFDVVAVPQTNISEMLDTAKDTISKPVNIKIKLKNKEDITHGFGVTIPKFSTTGPKKVRLVSSDQTIISFDLFMENDDEEKVPKKPHKFFKLFKASGCFSNQNDDDVYPYLPNSSNETYRAKSTSYVNDLQDNKRVEEKFALKKTPSPMIFSNITLRTPTFLGKCKPGGCLDPPFGEDKYIYKPKHKILAIDQKNIEEQGLVINIKDTKNTANDIVKPDTSSQDSLNKSFIEKTYSHSLITYPPALSSNERVKEDIQSKRSKLRTSTEKKVRISVNEFSDTYFMPPKKQKSKNNEKLSTEFIVDPNGRDDSCDTKSKIDTFALTSQKEHMLLSTNEPFNQDIGPIILNPRINESYHKLSDDNFVNDDKNVTIGESSDINIQNQILKGGPISVVSASELKLIDDTAEKKINSLATPQTNISSEDSENHDEKTKTDINLFETNLGSLSITTPSLIYKNTMITENVPITAKNSQITILESKPNDILYEIKSMPKQLIDNHLLASQEQNKLKSPKENLSLRSEYLDSNNETKIKGHLITSDEFTLTSSQTESQTVVTDIAENVLQVSLTKNAKLVNSNGQLIQHKESDHSSVKEQIQDIADMHQKGLQQNRSFQDVASTATIVEKDKSNTNNIFVKHNSAKKEYEKNDQDLATFLLSEAKSIQISSEEALTDLISTKSYKSEKKSSAIAADFKSDRNNMISDNIDSKIETELATALQKKISSTLQTQEKDNNVLNHYENKNSLDTHQIMKVTSSLNLTSPQALPEKTSSILHTQEKDTSKIDPVNDTNKISLSTSQILNLPYPILCLSDKATTQTDNFEMHSLDEVAQGLISIDPVEISNLKNIDTVSHYGLSTDIVTEKEASVDKNLPEIKPQLQLIYNEEIPILTGNEVVRYVSSDVTNFFNETAQGWSENNSKDYPDFYREPLKMNIPEIYPGSLKEAKITDDEVNVMKSEEESILGNKNSSIEINLGFCAYVNDNNETIIKTFDTSEYLKTDPRAKITIIKSIIRKNDSGIRIPINSEMDLTLQIKNNLNKVNISERDIDDIIKESTDKALRKSLNKDKLLQETLVSVYDNLVPVQTIIRNLKQETDLLTQQQVLLREMLNTMKTTSVKIINTNNKMCTCKYSM